MRLPSLSQEELLKIINSTDNLDVQSLNMGFSLNVGDAGARQQLQGLLLPHPTDRVPCSEEFYLFLTGDGEHLAHIGLFMGQGCAYAVFYDENTRPAYANAVRPEGITFFANMLNQVKMTPAGQ
jgi:hypothetical protein